MEKELEDIEADIENSAYDHEKLTGLMDKKGETESRLARMLEEWEEMMNKLDGPGE